MVTETDREELIATWLRADVTLLAEALDAVETGVDVDDGSLFVGGDVLVVETEQMLVTDVATNTLTVTRGHNSSAAVIHADNAQVSLFKSRRLKLAQPLQPQAVDNFPGKVTIGAYNIDSNDLLSAWIISDLTGGHGVADHDEGVTDNRYRFGSIYTRYAKQWTKPFQISESILGSGRVSPIGDLYYATNDTTYQMVVSGTDLYQSTTNRGAITAQPFDNGVQYRGTAAQSLFYIPQSASGYSTFNPATNTIVNNNAGSDPDARSFLVWDEKLLVIDKNGTISYATAAAGTTTFTPYTLGGNNVTLEAEDIRRMHVFYNRQGESVPYVVTNGSGVWAFDADTPRFYQIPDFNSVHPRSGLASTVWRGELYVSFGMDVLAFNGEVIRNVGLSRDDGIPYLYQGYISSFAPGQNGLYALVLGRTAGNIYSSVHEWSGFGWHCVWAQSHTLGSTRIAVSAAGAAYNLLWGLSNTGWLYTQGLPVEFTNPREAIDNNGAAFGVSWNTPTVNAFYLETGKFDANMKGYRKIANAVELDVRSIGTSNQILLYYRIDNDTAWTQLYHTDGAAPSSLTVTTAGHHTFEFGHYDSLGHYIGIDFETIEFQLWIQETGSNSTTPAISSIVFNFLKIMNPSLAWTAQIDLVEPYHDGSQQVILDELTELRTLPRFFTIQHRARTYRARMTGMQSVELGGDEEAATAQLSLIEIPSVLGLAAS